MRGMDCRYDLEAAARARGSLGPLNDSLLLESERWYFGSGACGGVLGDEVLSFASPLRRILKMECRRDCDWGSVDDRTSLEIGCGDGGTSISAGREGEEAVDNSTPVAIGTSWGDPGEALSGFAMRKPPKD